MLRNDPLRYNGREKGGGGGWNSNEIQKKYIKGEEKAGGKADCRVERMNLNKGRIKELRPR